MPEERDLISRIFAARSAMQALPVTLGGHQGPANASQIFELQRINSDQYYLLPTNPAVVDFPRVHGLFNFVILASDPGRIYCGVPYTGPRTERRFMIEGHTSLSHRKDVLYAGELFFLHGWLDSWSNGSGHYRPDESLRHINLIPAVQRLLPDSRFANWNSRNLAQMRLMLASNGSFIAIGS